MYAFILLAVAIVGEVTATLSLKLSAGFSRLVPSAVVVVGYAVAFTALGKLLKLGFPIGVAYAIWSAVGVAAIAVIGAVLFDEKITLTTAVGLVLIVAGVVVLELGRS